jgi:hypothetical protein
MDLGLEALSNITYKLACPVCGKEREFATKQYFYKARKHDKACISCSNSIKSGGKGNLYHGNSKTCSTCDVIKPLSDFFSYKNGNYHSCCKCCSKLKCQEYHKNTYRFARHGISKEQFGAMILGQDSNCIICKKELSSESNIDHDHITGKIRGVLCGKCNKGLGLFNDDVNALKNAIKYLNNNK